MFLVKKPPIESGTRVVVYGNLQPYAKAIVAECVYKHDEGRWAIILDWGVHGMSRVCDTDEGNVWYRYETTN